MLPERVRRFRPGVVVALLLAPGIAAAQDNSSAGLKEALQIGAANAVI